MPFEPDDDFDGRDVLDPDVADAEVPDADLQDGEDAHPDAFDDDVLDDDALDLPPLPAVGEEEEEGIDVDPGLGLDLGEEEEIGLDAAEGLDDFDPVDFLDEGLDEAVDLSDAEEAGDLVGGLGEGVADSEAGEYGWTDGTETFDSAEWDDEDLVDEIRDGTEEDDGALFDVDAGLHFDGDDDLAGLPPLDEGLGDEDGEELADDLDLQGDGDIDLAPLSFEEEARLMGSQLPPPLDLPAERLFRGPAYDVTVVGEVLWVASDELVRLPVDAGAGALPETVRAEGLEAEELLTVAAAPDAVIVGTRLGGVFRSMDGGARFEPINGWRSGGEPSVGCHVRFDGAGRLWLWAGGALYRSEDLGSRWTGPVLPSPVLDATLDEEGRLVVLVGSGGQLDFLRARVDGRAFDAVGAPLAREAGRAYRLAARGEQLAVAGEGEAAGPAHFAAGRWERLDALA
ncbi:MAG TPA: hypothetical protein RMG95_01740, partial [Polyangiaceae bacterium LLY-WYZ-15_(1-7)]|nr:hypothetical protein [Polyangiaceae bacterium LLY-WYZ-15_(1-7)]